MYKQNHRHARITTRGKLVLLAPLCLAVVLLWPDKTADVEVLTVVDEPLAVAPVPIAAPIVWHEGDFGSTKPFYKRLGKFGLDGNQIHDLIEVLTPVYDFRKSHPNHKWSVGLRDGQAVQFVLEVAPDEIYDVVSLSEEPSLTRREIAVFTERVVVRGEIEDSLYRSLAHEPSSAALVVKLAGVFAWDIDFYQDPRRGDTFEMIVEKRYIRGEEAPIFMAYGQILAARYEGQRESFEAYRFQPTKGEAGYYNAAGKSLIRDVLRSPLKIQRVTSSFKRNRYHPVLKKYRPHNGVDYGASRGTPVMAVAHGKVVRAGRWGGAGIAVVLSHKDKLTTQYFHLLKVGKGIRRGARVKQGQIIGYVGKTGLASGYHLHFGMKKRGKYVNPLRQKFQPGVPIAKGDKSAFAARVSIYGAALEPVVVPLAPVVRLQSPLNPELPDYGPRASSLLTAD